jgi:hypothetical protein
MPITKHKRKASAHYKAKNAKSDQSSGLVSKHPKTFVLVGWLLVLLAIYLLAFESQNNAMFGVSMLSLVVGLATTIYANFVIPKENK